MAPFSLLRMELHGLQGILTQQEISMESPTETIPLWQWVLEEPFAHHRMELVFKTPIMSLAITGIQGLLGHQTLSMESPPDEAHSPCPLGKALPLLTCYTEKIFRSGKPESVGTT